MSVAIKVENLSKTYRLGQIGKASLQEEIASTWAKIRGKPDPTLPVNQEKSWREGNLIHALQDINFEVQQGEVLGIIGKNGAGKSTLLKMLSKVTSPSSGQIKVRGRIASLLEVGTGMHPELTGRENIFLNGAILGMHKAEIKQKLDAIIDFAGVSDYIDTPIKRYSSGMRVRLGFAVAAFLEPEILIVDEVLAVGDAEFQKKAIGKMQDVSKGEGRTVLFVSHNMVAVNNLCNQAIFLDKGLLIDISNSDIIIKEYLGSRLNTPYNAINKISEDGFFKLISIQLKGVYSNNLAEIEKLHKICVLVEILEDIDQMLYHTNLFVKDGSNNILFVIQSSPEKTLKGIYEIIYEIPANIMNDITYTFDIMLIKNQSQIIIDEKDVFSLEAIETIHRKGRWLGKFPGIIRPYFFKTQTTLVNPNNESETAI